jgi:hypothetical protein
LPVLIKKNRAKIAGCICRMCCDVRDELLVPAFF